MSTATAKEKQEQALAGGRTANWEKGPVAP